MTILVPIAGGWCSLGRHLLCINPVQFGESWSLRQAATQLMHRIGWDLYSEKPISAYLFKKPSQISCTEMTYLTGNHKFGLKAVPTFKSCTDLPLFPQFCDLQAFFCCLSMQSDHAKQSLMTRLVGEEGHLKFARAWEADCSRLALYQAMGWADTLSILHTGNRPSTDQSSHEALLPDLPGLFTVLQPYLDLHIKLRRHLQYRAIPSNFQLSSGTIKHGFWHQTRVLKKL